MVHFVRLILIPQLGSSVAGFFGRFLGSEGTAMQAVDSFIREGLQGGGPNAYNLAEVSPCGDQVHHKIAEICRSENSFDP